MRFRWWKQEQELDEEVRGHLEMAARERVERGAGADDAARTARREFGNMELVRETTRDMWGWNWLRDAVQDVRYGLRILGRTPVLTAVAVFSLALGIGANTAIFSLLDAVVLRLLPVHKPEELMQIKMRGAGPGGLQPTFTNPIWEEVRDHQDVFAGVFAWSSFTHGRFDLARGGPVQYANGVIASGGFFAVLGVRPAAGRLFTAEDDRRGCPGVAVLGYGFWQDHFGGAASAIGSTLSLDNHDFQVIGVSAPGFYGVDVGNKFDVAIPICSQAVLMGDDTWLTRKSTWWLHIAGRMKPAMSVERSNSRLAVLSPQLLTPATPTNWPAENQQEFLKRVLVASPAGTGTSFVRSQFQQPLTILMGVVGLVLLIACANIASLMLARSAARGKEIAVRKALGASRGRLIRQLLTECVLLSSAGAVLGFAFAQWGSALLVRFISTAQDQVFLDFSLNARVLGFTAAIAVLTGVLFGVLPAFRSTRVSLLAAMKGGQAEDSERRMRFRPAKWIVASQVALSLVLLVGAGLFLRSFAKLTALDIGFDRNNVLLANVNLKTAKVPAEQYLATYEALEQRLKTLPGVVSVGRSFTTPVSHMEWNEDVHIDDAGGPVGDAALTYYNFVSAGYFETLRIPVVRGRGFVAGDSKTAMKVAIVNETMVRRFFPNKNPIGQYFRGEDEPGKPAARIQIVGIVKDSKYDSLREETFAQAFLPIAQIPEGDEQENFEVRTIAQPSVVIPAVQEAVGSVNKAIPIEIRTLAGQVDDSLVQERLLATLSVFFGGLALLLAIIGLYGAVNYLANQRQAEFGIRRALGAEPGAIFRLVMRDVVAILTAGIAGGVCIAAVSVGVLQKLMFGLAVRDTTTMMSAVGVMALVAFFAGYLPARRAMRADPMAALRYE